MKLQDICQKLNLELSHSEDKIITGLNTLKDASTNEISFLENSKYLSELETTNAGAVFVKKVDIKHVPKNCVALECDEPYITLAYASKLFAPSIVEKNGKNAMVGDNTTIQENVFLGKNSTIGKNCTIMSGSFIGDYVSIGDNTIIYPNVTIYRDCEIGNNTIIHSGTVIGSDGFGFATDTKTGTYIKIYQNGNVKIGNHVEIGASCTIDRAAFKSTIIEDMVRIDNLVHIAHNCVIGRGSILVTQVGISGSTTLGEYVVMAGQSAAVGHISIAPFTTIHARGGVTKSITEPKKHWGGFPLMEQKAWLKLQAKIQRLLKKG